MAAQLHTAAGEASAVVLMASVSICSEAGEGVVPALEAACSHRHGDAEGLRLGEEEAGRRDRVKQLLQGEFDALQADLLKALGYNWGAPTGMDWEQFSTAQKTRWAYRYGCMNRHMIYYYI